MNVYLDYSSIMPFRRGLPTWGVTAEENSDTSPSCGTTSCFILSGWDFKRVCYFAASTVSAIVNISTKC